MCPETPETGFLLKFSKQKIKRGTMSSGCYSWLYCVCCMVFTIAQKFSMGVSNWT